MELPSEVWRTIVAFADVRSIFVLRQTCREVRSLSERDLAAPIVANCGDHTVILEVPGALRCALPGSLKACGETVLLTQVSKATVAVWSHAGDALYRARHRSSVVDCAVAGNTLATLCVDGNARLYDLDTGSLRHRIYCSKGFDVNPRMRRCALSHDGRLLATSGRGLAVWKASSGELRDRKAHRVASVVFSPVGRTLCVSTEDDDDDDDGSRAADEQERLGVDGRRPVFSPDGELLAVLSDCSTELCIHTADASALRATLRISGEKRDDDSDDDEASVPPSLEYYDYTLRRKHRFVDYAFAANGRWLATHADDSKLRIWRLADRRVLHVLDFHRLNEVLVGFSFSPEGTMLVTRSSGLRLWDTCTGTAVGRLDLGDRRLEPPYSAGFLRPACLSHVSSHLD